MLFRDIPGLEIEKKRLISLVRNNRLPHALMLYGPEGNGKLALSLALMTYISCKDQGDEDACGVCLSCQKSTKLIQPDAHYYFPLSGGKEFTSSQYVHEWRKAVLENPYLTTAQWQETIEIENKLLNITVTECQNMVRDLSLAAFEDGYRMLLIWLPEYLGKEGNILLKLIEEPPTNSLILLITENIQAILPTILSRCQTITIPAFKPEEIKSALTASGVKDEAMLQSIALSADGNMGEAMRMVSTMTNPHTDKLLNWLRLCFRNKDIIQWCDQFAGEGRESHRQFLKYGLYFIEQIIKYKISLQKMEGIPADEWKGISGLSNQLSVDELNTLAELFNDHIGFIERNANAKILFTALSVNVHQLLNHRKVDVFEMIG